MGQYIAKLALTPTEKVMSTKDYIFWLVDTGVCQAGKKIMNAVDVVTVVSFDGRLRQGRGKSSMLD